MLTIMTPLLYDNIFKCIVKCIDTRTIIKPINIENNNALFDRIDRVKIVTILKLLIKQNIT